MYTLVHLPRYFFLSVKNMDLDVDIFIFILNFFF